MFIVKHELSQYEFAQRWICSIFLANMKMLIFRSGDFMRGKSFISIVSLRGAGGIKLRESLKSGGFQNI